MVASSTFNAYKSTSEVTSHMMATHLENLESSGNSKVVREKSGELKSVSSYSPNTTDTSTDTGLIYCVILHLLYKGKERKGKEEYL